MNENNTDILENTETEKEELIGSVKDEFLKFVDTLPVSNQMGIMKAISKAGLNEHDSLYAYLYIMGYIKTMYEDIPTSLDGLSEKLSNIGNESATKIKEALGEILNKSTSDTSETIKQVVEIQKRFKSATEKQITEIENKVQTLLNDLNREIDEKFKKMLDEQTKMNTLTEKKAVDFEKKVESSVGKIVEDAGRGLQVTLDEQKKLNKEIQESAKVYQIGISLSNKQLALSVEKQKVKIVEIFIDTLKRDLPEVIEEAVLLGITKVEAKRQSEKLKTFGFYTAIVTTSIVLSHIINHFIK